MAQASLIRSVSFHSTSKHEEFTGPWYVAAVQTADDTTDNIAEDVQQPSIHSFKRIDSTDADLSSSPEDNLFDWVLVFPLPSKDPSAQGAFDKWLKNIGMATPEKLLETAFHAAIHSNTEHCSRGENKITRALESLKATPPPGQAASEPLLGGSTLEAVQQTVIELVLASIKALDKAIGIQLKPVDGEPPPAGDCFRGACFTGSTAKDNDSLYICLKMGGPAVELLADLTQYPLQLSKKSLTTLRPPVNVDDKQHVPAYAKFRRSIRQKYQMYTDAHEELGFGADHQGGKASVLREIDRLRLLYDTITDMFDLDLLKSAGLMSHSFPLHHRKFLRELRDGWGYWRKIPTFEQPINEIRHYYGEEIAHYFLFLQCLGKSVTNWLLVPGVVSQVVATYCYFNDQHTAVFANRIIIATWIMSWYRCFTLQWFQKEMDYIESWGVDQHRSGGLKTLLNSRIKGTYQKSKLDGHKMERTVSANQKLGGRIGAVLLTNIFVMGLMGLLTVEHLFFFQVSSSKSIFGRDLPPLAVRLLPMALGVTTGIQIKVVDDLWDALGNHVVDLESRTYRYQFEDSKRIKAVFVKFLTTMTTMFFFAFVQPMMERNQDFNVAWRIQMVQQMMSTFIVRFIVLGTMNHLAKPFANLFFSKARMGRDFHKKTTSYIEFQAVKEVYSSNDLTTDYLDVLLPFCFVIFFGAIVPGCVVLFVILVMVETRSDAMTLTHVFQRPFPKLRNVEGLKQFQNFLEACGHFMIVTKMALLFFELKGVVQLDIPGLATAAHLPIEACNHTNWNMSGVAGTLEDEEANCQLISDLVNILSFLLATLTLIALWHLMSYLVSKESYHTRIERYRHDLQRHRLLTTNQLRLPELQSKHEGAVHTDFSKLANWGKRESIMGAADVHGFEERPSHVLKDEESLTRE